MKTLANFIAVVAMMFIFILSLSLLVSGKKSEEPVVVVPKTESRLWVPPVAEPLSFPLEKEGKKAVEPVSFALPTVEIAQGSRRKTTDDILIERKARFVIKKYGPILKEAAVEYGLDWREITAYVVIESEGNPNARSTSGAEGLMQLKPGAAKDVGVKNRKNPQESIFGGAKYLKGLKRQGYGDVKERALAYYNGAKGAGKFLASGREPREHFYVPKVLHAYWVIQGIEPA